MWAGFLMPEDGQVIIWHGSLISSVIMQFWGDDIRWGHLDYLLVDLPLCTSDVALTVMQSLPISSIVMVTTPQSLTAMIVLKAVTMAQAVKIPIVGIVENMGGFFALDTSRHYHIFGPSHVEEVAAMASAPILACLPLDPHVEAMCDAGEIEAVVQSEVEVLAETL
jgi:Mrp family chromosome partitioning ATPase